MTTRETRDWDDDVPDRFTVEFEGLTLLGTYRVENRLARGGMGSIYLAEDTNLGRPVVIKVPHPRFLGEPGFRERFAKEVEDLVRLEHPSIARILARGEHDQLPFFILQFLGGGSLEDRLQSAPGGRIAPKDVLPWLRTTAETLDFVHARGIVHRDVKPGNILFDEEGHVFLSDFGVAKALEAESGLTGTGVGIGSPKYMAPEQGMGQEVGPPADLYSLACVVYEALAGAPPYGEGTLVEILVKKGREDPETLASLVPDLPEDVSAVVMQALSREPGERFATCSAFAEAYEGALSAHGLADSGTPTGFSLPRVVGPPASASAAHGRAHRTHHAIILLLVLALVGVGLWLLLGGGNESAPQKPSTPSAGNEKDDSGLTLVSAGEEPRGLLRYRVAAGARERLAMTTEQRMEMRIGEGVQEFPVQGPWVMGSDVTVEKVTDGGEIHFTWEVVSAANPEDPDAPVLALLERMVGVRAVGVVNDRGRTVSADLSGRERIEAEIPMARLMLQSLSMGLKELCTRLPEEPVGVGARWEITEVLDQMGMRLTQTKSFELKALEGYRAVIRVSIAQTAPEQRLTLPGFEPGMNIRLLSHHSRGGGDIELDLTQLVPVTSKIEIHSVMQVGVEVEGEDRKVDMTQEMKVALERR